MKMPYMVELKYVLPFLMNPDISSVVEKNGVEVLATKLSKNKPCTGGVSRKYLQQAYIRNNRSPTLRHNEPKSYLVKSLMKI